MDLSNCQRVYQTPRQGAEAIRQAVMTKLGLPATIGLATNRTIAKISCDMAKPNGLICVLAGEEAEFLSPLPLSKVPGLGPKSCKRLNEMGLRSIGEILRLRKGPLRAAFGRHGEGLLRRLQGSKENTSPVTIDRRSISAERTFGNDIVEAQEIHRRLIKLVDQVCYRLRQEGMNAGVVTLKLRYADFSTINRAHSLPAATDRNGQVRELAKQLLAAAHTRRQGIRLLGVKLSGLVEGARQLSLFAAAEDDKEGKLLMTLDGLAEKHKGKVSLGVSSTESL